MLPIKNVHKVQSAGFTDRIVVGIPVEAAIAFPPVGLVAGLIIGGAVAIDADIGVKVVAEKNNNWFEERS